MKRASLIVRGAALACALCAASLPALAQNSSKQSNGPARWSTAANTKAQRTAILKKEINAAYAQQQSECRRQAASQRSSCLTAARQVYRQDMANVPKLLAQAPTGEVTERVVSTTPAPAPTMTTQAGATTASGSSGAGSTGAGTSATGMSATGMSATGTSATGTSATGSSGAGMTGSSSGTGANVSTSSSRSGEPVNGGGIRQNTATGMDSPQSLQPQHSGDEVQGPPPIVTPPPQQQ